MASTTESITGADLRAMRHAANKTRQQVAGEARCSLSMLGILEGGYIPERSDVLPRVLAALNDVEAPGKGLDEKERGGGAHGSG